MSDIPMRLGGDSAPVLPYRLRIAPVLAPGWPPDVAPNQVIESAHINQIRSSVAAWPADVDAQSHTLRNVNIVNATGVMVDPTTAAGDLIVRSDQVNPVKLPVGTQGQVLTVDTALPAKMRWVTPVPVVASVFNRTGAVVAQAGDYSAAQVTNAVDTTKTYVEPGWLAAVNWSIVTNRPATYAPSAHTHAASDVVSGRFDTARLGAGVADANVYLRGDGQWAAAPAGGGGGGAGVASFKGRTGAVEPQTGDYSAAMVSQAVVDQTIAVGDLLVRGTSAIGRLPVGANGQILTADNAVAGGIRWGTAPGGPGLPGGLTDGDLAQWKSGAWQILPVGTTGQVLMVDTAGNGLRWGAGGGGSQTPWLTDVDGGNHALSNVSSIVSNGPIKSNAGGFMFPDGSTQTSAAGQSPWNTDIDAMFHNVYKLGRKPAAAAGSGGSAINMLVQDGGNDVAFDIGTKRTAVGSGHGYIEQRMQRTVDATAMGFIAFRSGGPAVVLGNGIQDMMTVADTGNVGIGVASPAYKLDVAGDLNYTGTIRKNGTAWNPQTPWVSDIDGANFTLNNVLAVYAHGTSTVFLSNNLVYNNGWKLKNAGPGMYFYNTGNLFAFQCAPAGAAGSAASVGDVLTLNPTYRSVGVGTPTEAAMEGKFTVDGGNLFIRSGGQLAMRRADNGWDMRLQQTAVQLDVISGGAPTTPIASFVHGGNVGIGTGTGAPLDRLSIIGANAGAATARQLMSIGESTNNPAYRLAIGYYADSSWKGVVDAVAGNIGTPLILNPTGGRVGIGTTAPGYQLHVAGTMGCSGDFACENVLLNNTNGTAGINMRIDGYMDHLYLVTENGGDVRFQVVGADRLVVASSGINASVNMAVIQPALSGYTCGVGSGANQYGAVYFDPADASINIYHSNIGFVLKIKQDGPSCGYYMPYMRGDAGPANSGRLYRSGNTLMIS